MGGSGRGRDCGHRPVTVIVVPVYNAPEELERCLAGLERTVGSTRRVALIDDASTDPRVPKLLEGVAGHWEVFTNPFNQGFVATANRGMDLAGSSDVVLLNSDTIPAGSWLEAMESCAASDPSIASATPFTNNGEIASIPRFCHNNPLPEDPEQWARACWEAGTPSYPEIPTAVGFCMYMRRACIDEIGKFDVGRFGRGYGEENDWSMRAIKAGWRNVLCDNAYVAHSGGASFGPLGLGPGDEAMERLLQLHPDYMDRVSRFIEKDPLAKSRARVLKRLDAMKES